VLSPKIKYVPKWSKNWSENSTVSNNYLKLDVENCDFHKSSIFDSSDNLDNLYSVKNFDSRPKFWKKFSKKDLLYFYFECDTCVICNWVWEGFRNNVLSNKLRGGRVGIFIL